MWIFSPTSLVSIVDKGDPTGKTLLVRGRKAGDIEDLFPDAEVHEGGGTDYRYRARLDREVVAQKIADQVRGINFTNFKNQVADHDRHDAYLDVWRAMYDFQRKNEHP